MAHMFSLSHVMWHIGQISTMPHRLDFKPCHVTHRLSYDMPHGTYVRSRPCHVTSRQGIIHATYVMPRPSHVAHMVGLSHPTWHLSITHDMPHGTYARSQPCHVELMTCHMAPILAYAMPCGTYVRLKHATWHLGQARTCHVAHRLGWEMPCGTQVRLRQDMTHGTYVRPRQCHVALS